MFKNVGLGDLGTASRRNVGTGANQIPDMSSFAS
ncbi:phage tail protein, partial [Klebsiella michiganensis]